MSPGPTVKVWMGEGEGVSLTVERGEHAKASPLAFSFLIRGKTRRCDFSRTQKFGLRDGK